MAIFIALNMVYCIAFLKQVTFSGALGAFLAATPICIGLFILGHAVFVYRKRLQKTDAGPMTVVERPFDIPQKDISEFFDPAGDISTLGKPFIPDTIVPDLPDDYEITVKKTSRKPKVPATASARKSFTVASITPVTWRASVKENLTVEETPLASLNVPASLSVVKDPEEPSMFDEIPVAEDIPDVPVLPEILPDEPPVAEEPNRVYYKTRAEALTIRQPGERIYRKTGKGGGHYIVTPKSTK